MSSGALQDRRQSTPDGGSGACTIAIAGARPRRRGPELLPLRPKMGRDGATIGDGPDPRPPVLMGP
jgi:hypothetical protein